MREWLSPVTKLISISDLLPRIKSYNLWPSYSFKPIVLAFTTAWLDRRESIEMPVPLTAYLMENLDCKVVLVDLCFLPSASAKVWLSKRSQALNIASLLR